MNKDEKFMKVAVNIAKESEITPYAAVIIKDNKIIAKTSNNTIQNTDPTAHAEVSVIREACKKLNTQDLSNCVLYSTCEPCPMCLSACFWANIFRVVYGATIEDAKKRGRQIEVPIEYISEKMNIKLTKEVLREDCIELFK